MRFITGNSGNPAGRPKGAEDKAKREIKEYARNFLSSPEYVASIEGRIIAGLAPNIELALYHYAYGKPKERVEHSIDRGPTILKVVYPDQPQQQQIESQPIDESQVIDLEARNGCGTR